MKQRSWTETALHLAPGFAFVAHLAVALTHGGPVAVPDVPAYLSIAQRLWGAVPVAELPYHPGYGFLVGPLGFLDGDALHTAALCVNALLAALVVWMVQRLVRQSTAPQWVLWASTAIAFLHPSVSHASRVAWPETLLTVLLLAIGLCITNSHQQRWGVAGVLAGFAPLIHPRAVVLAGSLLVLGWLARRSRQTLIGVASGLLITAIGLQMTDTWQAARLTAAQDIGSEPGPVATVAGQLLAFSTSTACLGLIGIFAGIATVVRRRTNVYDDDRLAFFALSAVATLVLGGWVLAGSDRSDTLLYGRYMDPWAVPVAVSVLCLIAKRSVSRKMLALAAATVVVSFGLVRLETSEVTQPARGVMTASLRALWVVADENMEVTLVIAVLMSLISIAGLRRHVGIAVVCLVLVAATSTVLTHTHLRDVGQVASGQMTVASLVSHETSCLGHDGSSVKPYAIWLYRLQLPEVEHRQIDLGNDNGACGVYVVADKDSLQGCKDAEFLGQEPRATWGLWRYPVAGCG